MTYNRVYELIAAYCNADGKTLPVFADRWSRWPADRAGHFIITKLADQAHFWETRNPPLFAELTEAQIAVRNHLGGAV